MCAMIFVISKNTELTNTCVQKNKAWQLLANSFAVRHQSQIKGRRIALIDDVVTTGASATAVTNCLLSMGVKSVDIWCIARTGWHNTPS